jgi:hypothetical protein
MDIEQIFGTPITGLATSKREREKRLLFYQQKSVQLRAASVKTARRVCPSDFPSFLSAVASLLSLRNVFGRVGLFTIALSRQCRQTKPRRVIDEAE